MQETNALTVHQPGAMVAPESAGDAFLAVIERISRNPDVNVDAMRDILAMKIQVMAIEAKTAFSVAMKAAQEEMRPVVRDAQNTSNNSKYARLETIDAKIRPIYTKHGFSLTFNSPASDKDTITASCRVLHDQGHSEDYQLTGGLDIAGIKGSTNKTPIQATGSSMSYLRRYLTAMIFNVILINEDNDGQAYVTDEEAMDLSTMMAACEMNDRAKAAFFKLIGAKSIEELPHSRYMDIKESLRAKLAQKQGGAR